MPHTNRPLHTEDLYRRGLEALKAEHALRSSRKAAKLKRVFSKRSVHAVIGLSHALEASIDRQQTGLNGIKTIRNYYNLCMRAKTVEKQARARYRKHIRAATRSL